MKKSTGNDKIEERYEACGIPAARTGENRPRKGETLLPAGTKIGRIWDQFKNYGINIILLGAVTGIFAGVIVTVYTALTSIGEEVSAEYYTIFLEHPAFIPLLFLGLAAGALVIGTVVRLVPMIRGSGIPQIEGAARGVVVFRWYVVLCTMFAASLACVFMGLAAGSEGPSVEMGGCAGAATGSLFRRTQMVRRLQIAAGSSAGFAVAFNAPISGLIFAMEEAFRSFSPQVFLSSAVSVIAALLTSSAIRGVFNEIAGTARFSTGFSFQSFVFSSPSVTDFLYIMLAALIVTIFAVGFYHAVFAMQKVLKKITFFKGAGRFLIPFLFAGAAGLVTVYAMGGGHSFIEALGSGGTGEMEFDGILGLGILASLLLVVLLRFLAGVLNMGASVPCGAFVPMLALGAGAGAILSVLFQKCGFSGESSDYLIIICMAVFFTVFARAPITGLFMIFEFTGQITNLLPALAGIAIGYAVPTLLKMQPGYERILNQFIESESKLEKAVEVRIEAVVQADSQADGVKIGKLVWPSGGMVVDLVRRDGSPAVANGSTVLHAGDRIIFECMTDNEIMLREYLYDMIGQPSDEDE